MIKLVDIVGIMLNFGSTSNYDYSNTLSYPTYHDFEYETACKHFVFRARFRNNQNGTSHVRDVSVDGRSIFNAAKTFNRFAAGRPIKYIGIMNCGMDPESPVFRGTIQLIKPESQPDSRSTGRYFRLIRNGRDWRMTVD